MDKAVVQMKVEKESNIGYTLQIIGALITFIGFLSLFFAYGFIAVGIIAFGSLILIGAHIIFLLDTINRRLFENNFILQSERDEVIDNEGEDVG